MPIEIHSQLLADCHRLGRTGTCEVLLHRNAVIPWFIVVPDTAATDLLDLGEEERNAVMGVCADIATFIKSHWSLTKTNFAGLGNVVPQLHLHVIGRKTSDSCWPKPVWGNLNENAEYTAQDLQRITLSLTGHLREFHPDDSTGAREICFTRQAN